MRSHAELGNEDWGCGNEDCGERAMVEAKKVRKPFKAKKPILVNVLTDTHVMF